VVLDARRQGHGATLAAPHHAAHAVLHTTTFNNTLLTPRKKTTFRLLYLITLYITQRLQKDLR
jgi:hypothetical protein